MVANQTRGILFRSAQVTLEIVESVLENVAGGKALKLVERHRDFIKIYISFNLGNKGALPGGSECKTETEVRFHSGRSQTRFFVASRLSPSFRGT